MSVPEQLDARAAEMENCAQALAELAETARRRAEDVSDVEAALRRYRVDLNTTWQGFAQVSLDDDWGTVAVEMNTAVSSLCNKAQELDDACNGLYDQAADLRSQAARIRQQHEEQRARQRAAA